MYWLELEREMHRLLIVEALFRKVLVFSTVSSRERCLVFRV